jgi:hypothetical protein
MEDVGIFYDHLYFVAFDHDYLVYFYRFGMVYQEKSGNPVLDLANVVFAYHAAASRLWSATFEMEEALRKPTWLTSYTCSNATSRFPKNIRHGVGLSRNIAIYREADVKRKH